MLAIQALAERTDALARKTRELEAMQRRLADVEVAIAQTHPRSDPDLLRLHPVPDVVPARTLPMDEKRRPLKDIRYFATSTVPAAGVPLLSDAHDQFRLPRDVHRTGQRIACLLEAEGFSIGPASHLYVALTAALAPGAIVPVGAGFDAWQHYVACGVARDIARQPAREQRRQVEALTFDTLRAVAPTLHDGAPQEDTLSAVQARVDGGGTSTRILRAVKDTAAYRIEVWFDVPDLSGQAHLYVVAHDRRTGAVLEAPPFPLDDHEHAFPLVAGIGVSKGCVNLAPRKSAQADLVTRKYPHPLRFPLSSFGMRSAKFA